MALASQKHLTKRTIHSEKPLEPNSYESNLVPSPSHYPAFRPTGYMLLLLLMVVDEMRPLFFHAAQRQTSGFDGLRGIPSRGCALQLDIVEEMAGGRQEARNREAGRRKDGTTYDPRTPRKGRLRPVKLQLIHPAAVSTCCPFWFAE